VNSWPAWSLILEFQHTLLTPKILRTREHTPILSVVFTFELAYESFKDFGGVSIANCYAYKRWFTTTFVGNIKIIIFYSHYMIGLCSCSILVATITTCYNNMVGVLFLISITRLTSCWMNWKMTQLQTHWITLLFSRVSKYMEIDIFFSDIKHLIDFEAPIFDKCWISCLLIPLRKTSSQTRTCTFC
jgi:hypothetical protein